MVGTINEIAISQLSGNSWQLLTETLSLQGRLKGGKALDLPDPISFLIKGSAESLPLFLNISYADHSQKSNLQCLEFDPIKFLMGDDVTEASPLLGLEDWYMLPESGGHPKEYSKGDPAQVYVKIKNYGGSTAWNVLVNFKLHTSAYYDFSNIWTGWQFVASSISPYQSVGKTYNIGPFINELRHAMNTAEYYILAIKLTASGIGEPTWTINDPYNHIEIGHFGESRVVFAHCLYDQEMLDRMEDYTFGECTEPQDYFDLITPCFRDHNVEDEFDIDIMCLYGEWNPGSSSPYNFGLKLRQAAGDNLNLDGTGNDWHEPSSGHTTDWRNHGFDIVWAVTGHHTYRSGTTGTAFKNWCWVSAGCQYEIWFWPYWLTFYLSWSGWQHVSQHELSHLFDAPDDCGEEGCPMDEDWGWDWCNDCEDIIAAHYDNYN